MGIFSALTGNNKRVEKRSTGIPDFLTSSATTNGISVNDSNVLSLTPVWSAISRISNIIASLPFNIYRSTKDGKELCNDHVAYKLLKDAPNEYQTAFDFKLMLVNNLLLYGCGCAEIEYDGRGFPIALHPIDPNKVQVINKDRKVTYKIDRGTGAQVIKQGHELILVKLWPRNDLTWESPLQKFREVFANSLSLRTYSTSVFSNGLNPAGVITGTNLEELDEASQASLVERFRQYSGLGKQSSLMLLSGQEDFKPIVLEPEKSQMLQSRSFDITEIARIFNLPPFMLYDLEKVTSWGTGIAEQVLGFYSFTLAPHLQRIESELNAKLIAVDDPSFYCKFKVDGLLRSDSKSRIESYEKAARMGIFTLDDILELEDRNRIGGAEGSCRLVPANMIPLTNLINKDNNLKQDNKND